MLKSSISIALAALVAAQLCLRVEGQASYIIKGRQISELPDALKELQRFIPDSSPLEERCERHAVLLKSFAKGPLDQFWVAEMALSNRNQLLKDYRTIDINRLRELYIDAIEQFRSKRMEAAALQLVECLRANFGSTDAKARSYLNKQDLKSVLEQYESIVAQPLSFLLDDDQRHPSLKLAELSPAVEAAAASMFAGDRSLLERKFGQPEAEPAVEVAEEAATEEAATEEAETEEAATEEVVTEEPVTEEAVTGAAPGDESDVDEYINRLTRNLGNLYENLPLTSGLGHRCAAYSKLVEADFDSLSDKLVHTVVAETAKHVEHSPADFKFEPEEGARRNFLLALNLMDGEQFGGLWIDMMQCAGNWKDEEAVAITTDPDRRRVFEQLMAAANPVEAEAVAATTTRNAPAVAVARAGPRSPPAAVVPETVSAPAVEETATPEPAPELAPLPAPTEDPLAAPIHAPAPEPLEAPQAEPGPEPQPAQVALGDKGHEHMETLMDMLSQVYNTMPLEAKLNDRCETYSELVGADHLENGLDYVDDLVEQLEAHLKTTSQTEELVFKPTADGLRDFLFALSSMDPKETADPNVWMDMMDCAMQWEASEPSVKEFMANPERQATYDELVKLSQAATGQAAA